MLKRKFNKYQAMTHDKEYVLHYNAWQRRGTQTIREHLT